MKRLLLLIAFGCGTAPAAKHHQPQPDPNRAAEPTPVVIADDASNLIEEAFRDHRRRYGEPAPFDPQKPKRDPVSACPTFDFE